jgi:hypothetical protein
MSVEIYFLHQQLYQMTETTEQLKSQLEHMQKLMEYQLELDKAQAAKTAVESNKTAYIVGGVVLLTAIGLAVILMMVDPTSMAKGLNSLGDQVTDMSKSQNRLVTEGFKEISKEVIQVSEIIVKKIDGESLLIRDKLNVIINNALRAAGSIDPNSISSKGGSNNDWR